MEKINFEWYRGDDESETLVFESDGEPMDFAGCSFDMDIVPEMGGSRRIHLSLSDGIAVNGKPRTNHGVARQDGRRDVAVRRPTTCR